jgi:hypothetical protein
MKGWLKYYSRGDVEMWRCFSNIAESEEIIAVKSAQSIGSNEIKFYSLIITSKACLGRFSKKTRSV